MINLISYEELGLLARPYTTEQEMAEALIAEAQREDIRRRLGDAVYLKLIDEPLDERFRFLLEGGVKDGQILTGIKTALAYYALARIIRDGNIQASTYGAVVKDDPNSFDPVQNERQRQYRELFSTADRYMTEVLDFLSCNQQEYPEFKPCKADLSSNRMRIRVLKRI